MSSNKWAFRFNDTPVTPASATVEIPRHISTKSALLDELKHQLQLPEYFGHNWDALEECIRDLSWLPPGTVIVRHLDLPLNNDTANLKIYLSILSDAADKWSRSGERDLIVIFPPDVEHQIERALNGFHISHSR